MILEGNKRTSTRRMARRRFTTIYKITIKMKKLNKMEIGALASKIGSELRKDYNDRVEREKEIQKESFLKTPLGRVITVLLEYPEGKDLLMTMC